MLTIPNVHLKRSATLVAYSGSKALRGPQCAGIVLGRKDIIKAAWMCSGPHHGHGRTMKAGKEEAMGMLMAVEMWVKRDYKAEEEMWTGWMNHIAGSVSKVDGVTAAVREPKGIGNRTPGLSITWAVEQLGITGQEVARILNTTEPRIVLTAGPARDVVLTAEQTAIRAIFRVRLPAMKWRSRFRRMRTMGLPSILSFRVG
jgi:seryl-tRNA(Sec) selenium transferase